MIDADVEGGMRSFLVFSFAVAGYNVVVQKGFNPTAQGAPLGPTIAFHKIGSRRFGWQGRDFGPYDSGQDRFDSTEKWFVEDTYQFDALMNPDVVDPARLTAYDVMGVAATLLNSVGALDFFNTVSTGIGIQRITDIRTPHSLDDSDRYVTGVSFDVVFSYLKTLDTLTNAARVDGTISRV